MKNKWFDPGTATEVAEVTLDAYLDEMFPDKDQNELIVSFLRKNFHQPYSNKRIWASYKDREDYWKDGWVDLTKEFANRTGVHIQVIFGNIKDETPNLQISLFTVVDMDWMQVFWGDIKSLEDLKFIFNCIGIKYTECQ